MKFTLLEMTQEILSAMESDEVNSINDTVESYQVALLLRSVFYDLAIDLGLPEHEGLFELNASGDPDQPTLMTIPANVSLVREVRYNIKEDADTNANYRTLVFKPFNDFYDMQNGLANDESGSVGEMTFTHNAENFTIMYNNDRMPCNYTTTDDYTFLFDSYDASIDTTLQKSKTMCIGVIYPVFTLEDTFTPDIDPTQFSLLKNRAKVRAFSELKQMENREAAGEARRQKIIVQKRKRSSPDQEAVMKHPRRYGRRTR